MRPRFMNRGSIAVGDPRTGECLRFNEAPIHESGKSCFIRHNRHLYCHRFNEAPIHESGK